MSTGQNHISEAMAILTAPATDQERMLIAGLRDLIDTVGADLDYATLQRLMWSACVQSKRTRACNSYIRAVGLTLPDLAHLRDSRDGKPLSQLAAEVEAYLHTQGDAGCTRASLWSIYQDQIAGASLRFSLDAILDHLRMSRSVLFVEDRIVARSAARTLPESVLVAVRARAQEEGGRGASRRALAYAFEEAMEREEDDDLEFEDVLCALTENGWLKPRDGRWVASEQPDRITRTHSEQASRVPSMLGTIGRIAHAVAERRPGSGMVRLHCTVPRSVANDLPRHLEQLVRQRLSSEAKGSVPVSVVLALGAETANPG